MTKTIIYNASLTLSDFHRSRAFYRGVRGPVGSGKSTAMCWEIMRRAQEQAADSNGVRRTRFAVIRNCYDDQTEILTERRGWQLFKDEVAKNIVPILIGVGAISLITILLIMRKK